MPNLLVNQLLSHHGCQHGMKKLRVLEVCQNPNFTGSSMLLEQLPQL